MFSNYYNSFLAAYTFLFGHLEIWLAAMVVLACVRDAAEDVTAGAISMAASLYVGSGLLLGILYLIVAPLA